MNLESRIDVIGEAIDRLARLLLERGFRFDSPAEVLPGPEDRVAGAIARIECEIGVLPLALKLFWRKSAA